MCLWFYTSWAFPLSNLQTSKIWSSNRRQSVTLHWEEQKSRQLLSMSGLCYYSVDCDSALPCCSADQWVSSGQTNSTNVVNLGSLIVYVAFTVWLNRWMNAVRQSCWVKESAWPGGCFLPWMGHIFRRDARARAQICQQTGPLIRSYQLSWSPLEPIVLVANNPTFLRFILNFALCQFMTGLALCQWVCLKEILWMCWGRLKDSQGFP